jgi:hypothetical protein
VGFAPPSVIPPRITLAVPSFLTVTFCREDTPLRRGRTNATSAGAAGVRPGPGAPGGGSAMAASRGRR